MCKRASARQYELIVEFMEQNGDISHYPGPGDHHERITYLQKWQELTDTLNQTGDAVRPVGKWRKAWSDLKNNLNKKVMKIKKNAGPGRIGADLNELEKRVLKVIEKKKAERKREPSSENDICFAYKVEDETDNYRKSLSPPPGYFCEVDTGPPPRRDSSSSVRSSQTSVKRRKSSENDIKNVTEKFLQFEQERDRRRYELEMARIRQNDQLITVFSRMVNILENLTPSIQRYLERK